MEQKRLYNIETDTLIILTPKDLSLEIAGDYIQIHYLAKPKFATIYCLALSKPHIVYHDDFQKMFHDIDIQYESNKEFDKFVKSLENELSGLGVKNLISHIKKHGYAIGTQWVFPHENTKKYKRTRLLKYLKMIGLAFPKTGAKI